MPTNINDAGNSIFYKRELETIRSKTYDVLYPSPKLYNKLPKGTDGDELAVDITHRTYNRVGVAKMGGGDYSTDFPRVDVFGVETTVHVKPVQDSYGYSKDEIARAAREGKPLEFMRAKAARTAIEDKLEIVAKTGDTATGLIGLFNQTGVTEYTTPVGEASGATTKFATKTADEILADLNGMIFAVQQGTNGVEEVDTIGLPMAQYNLIKTTRMSTLDGTTVLQYFKEQNPQITSIDWYSGLDTAAGASTSYTGTAMMIAWKNDADKLVFDLPLAFTQEDEQIDGMAHTIPCRAKTAGVTVFYPKSIVYAKGI